METGRSKGAVVDSLGSLYLLGVAGGLTDRQLLERFLNRDAPDAAEAAFAELVDRHGSMVLAVCRQELVDADDVRDAFQATFLVLVRRASSVRHRESVGGWLLGVARRVSARARVESARRRRHLARFAERVQAEAAARCEASSVDETALIEEVHRLPERFGAAVVLHYFEGLSAETTAHRLGCPLGTVLSRLSRARERLRRRLERRGVSPAVLIPAMEAPARWLTPAIVEPCLAQAATRAASALGLAGAAIEGAVPAKVAGLSRRVARRLALSRAGAAAALSLIVATCVSIGVAATFHPADEPRQQGGEHPRADAKPRPAPAEPQAKADVLVIRGQVLDPDGKPAAGADLVLNFPEEGQAERRRFGSAGPDGRFEVEIPRELVKEPPAGFGIRPALAATSPGFGPDWQPLDPAKVARPITLKLRRDDMPIEGRFVNREGLPVPGVSVRLLYIEDLPPDLIQRLRNNADEAGYFRSGCPFVVDEGKASRPVQTDRDGRFRLTGIGRDRLVSLELEGGSIETSSLMVATSADRGFQPIPFDSPREGSKIEPPRFEWVAPRGRTIEGTVRDRHTGRPIAGALVQTSGIRELEASGTSDAQGRFRLDGLPMGAEGFLLIDVEDQPYIEAVLPLKAQIGPDQTRVDVTLRRGVWATGRVVNAATGKPLSAIVSYYPSRENPHLKDCPDAPFLNNDAPSGPELFTDGEGRYRARVLPGSGVLVVGAMEHGYRNTWPADGRIENGFIYDNRVVEGARFCSGFAVIDAPDDRDLAVRDIRLVPSRVQHIRIADPEGRPVVAAGVRARGSSPSADADPPLASDELTFTVDDPGIGETFLVIHRERSIGAMVRLKGDEPDPHRVVLRKMGTVTGRLVDEAGRPRGHVKLGRLMVSEGRHSWPVEPFEVSTGPDGRFRIEHLIPGASYMVWVPPVKDIFGGYLHSKWWQVEPGEVQDWGDVRVIPYEPEARPATKD